MNSGLQNPSSIWRTWLEDLAFLATLPNDQLRLHVGFGYYLGAPIEKDLWAAASSLAELPDKRIEKYQADYLELTQGVPENLCISELDSSRERFSIQNMQGKFLNTDILRTQAEVSNLHLLGLFDEAEQIVEIGGGYGQLALALVSAMPRVKYVIVDFPEILDVVSRWISYVAPNLRIQRFKMDSAITIEESLEGGRFQEPGVYLVDNNLEGSLIKADLLINCNSFCEMSTSQVRHYCDRNFIVWDSLYSSNREKQFLNKDSQMPISEVLADFGQLWPTPDVYKALREQGLIRFDDSKFVYVLVRNNKTVAEIEPQRLHGLTKATFQALG